MRREAEITRTATSFLGFAAGGFRALPSHACCWWWNWVESLVGLSLEGRDIEGRRELAAAIGELDWRDWVSY